MSTVWAKLQLAPDKKLHDRTVWHSSAQATATASWDEIVVGQTVHHEAGPKTSRGQILKEVQQEPLQSFRQISETCGKAYSHVQNNLSKQFSEFSGTKLLFEAMRGNVSKSRLSAARTWHVLNTTANPKKALLLGLTIDRHHSPNAYGYRSRLRAPPTFRLPSFESD